ncbi:FAD-dependent monooxygenase [Amycolatopsis sp. NPDC051371]|uniref:FAD-dependent oxidoreductase n=1 Tax=Amycolatopsis sp. NPDC051371 TaxID=3155800 RepID=UPI00343E8448
MSVIIIGAGLGGLTLAQGLGRAGIPCQVYERDPSPEFRKQGYRLHIGGAGDTALREVLRPELHELFRATAGRALPHTNVYDERLRLLTRLEDEGTHLNINRFTLRQILLHGQEVSYGKRFTHHAIDEDGVTAHFADGLPHAAACWWEPTASTPRCGGSTCRTPRSSTPGSCTSTAGSRSPRTPGRCSSRRCSRCSR